MYSIPEEFSTAIIEVINTGGEKIKSIKIEDGGKGEIILKKGELASGIYFYRLVLNGKICIYRYIRSFY